MTRHKREQVSRRDLNSFRSCENVCLISRRRRDRNAKREGETVSTMTSEKLVNATDNVRSHYTFRSDNGKYRAEHAGLIETAVNYKNVVDD